MNIFHFTFFKGIIRFFKLDLRFCCVYNSSFGFINFMDDAVAQESADSEI